MERQTGSLAGEGAGAVRSLLVLLLLAVAVFSVYGNFRSLWLDEAHYVAYANKTWSSLIAGLKNDSHPPFYFLILSAWTSVFGDSELGVRSLSWVVYVIAGFAIFQLGHALFRDRTTALFCTVFYMTSRPAAGQAQAAHMYSLLGCLVALSTLFYARAFFHASGRRRDLALYLLVTAVGSFTHLWFFFVLLGQSVSVLLFCDRSVTRTYVVTTALAVLPYSLLWLPILLLHQVHTGAVDWMVGQSFGPEKIFETFADFYGRGASGALAWAGLLFAMLVRLGTGWEWRPGLTPRGVVVDYLRARETLLLITLFVVPLLTPLVISQWKPIYRVGTYTIVGMIPLSLLLGSALAKLGDRRLVLLLLHGLVIASVLAFCAYRWQQAQRCTDRQAAQYLLEKGRSGDAVIFTSLTQPPIDYYLDRAAAPPELTRISFPADQVEHPGWRSVQDLLTRKDELEREADRVVERLETLISRGGRIWLLYGEDTPVADILKNRLDETFSLASEHACKPTFFRVIREYAGR